MNILAIETASEACSAALITSEGLFSRFELAPREHTKLILPMMDEVLQDADIALKEIDVVAFSRGPGAFTGLRIAAGVAQGVALSIDKPVIAVSTLEALALKVIDENLVSLDGLNKLEEATIVVALDARMGEVYWGVFKVKGKKVTLIGEEKVSKPQDMLDEVISQQTGIGIGSGWDVYTESLYEEGLPENLQLIKNQYPSANQIAKLGLLKFKDNQAVPPEEAQPMYIRNNVAKKSKRG